MEPAPRRRPVQKSAEHDNVQLTRRAGLAGFAASAAGTLLPRRLAGREAEIVVGAPNALSGVFADLGTRGLWGMQLAVARINSGGGVKALGGARIALVSADTTSDDPARAADVTRRMIEQDRPVALLGAGASTMTLAVQAEAERAEIPLITSASADGIVNRGYRHTFKMAPQGGALWNWTASNAYALWREAKGRTPRSALIVMGDDAVGQVVLKHLPEHARSLGLALAPPLAFRTGRADVQAAVAAARRHRPDLIFLGGFPSDTVPLIKALRAAGVPAPVFGAGLLGTDAVGKGLGSAADKLFTPMAWTWDLAAFGNKELVAAYKEAHPDQPYPPANEQLGQGYVAAMILRQALETAASRDARKIRAVLATQEFAGLPYPNPTVRFGEKGLNVNNTAVLAEWIKGELRTVWPRSQQTVPPML